MLGNPKKNWLLYDQILSKRPDKSTRLWSGEKGGKSVAFTQEELEEIRRADEEIEKNFRLTHEDIRRARELDRAAELEEADPRKRRRKEITKRYREANREMLEKKQRTYREANREKVAAQQKAWREANKDYKRIYDLEYRRKKGKGAKQ